MSMLRPVPLLVASLLTLACEPDTVAPQTGSYSVVVETVADSCSLPASTAPFASPVQVDEQEVFLILAHGLGDSPVSRDPTGFARTTGPRLHYIREPETIEVGPCMTLVRSYELDLADEQSFHVTEEEAWTQAAGCVDPEPPAYMPAASCTAQRVFSFALTQACEAPCELVDGPAPGCSCG